MVEESKSYLNEQIITYIGNKRHLLKEIEKHLILVCKKLKKDNLISEDDEKKYGNEIQKMTDDSIKKIDDIARDLKTKGIDYNSVPIPDYIIDMAKEQYPSTWKEYLKKY